MKKSFVSAVIISVLLIFVTSGCSSGPKRQMYINTIHNSCVDSIEAANACILNGNYSQAEELLIKDYRLIRHLHDASMFRDYMPEWLFQLVKNLTVRKPSFNTKICALCRECVKICPASALSVQENRIKADYSKCIRCYCCHEVCSHHAITLRIFP